MRSSSTLNSPSKTCTYQDAVQMTFNSNDSLPDSPREAGSMSNRTMNQELVRLQTNAFRKSQSFNSNVLAEMTKPGNSTILPPPLPPPPPPPPPSKLIKRNKQSNMSTQDSSDDNDDLPGLPRGPSHTTNRKNNQKPKTPPHNLPATLDTPIFLKTLPSEKTKQRSPTPVQDDKYSNTPNLSDANDDLPGPLREASPVIKSNKNQKPRTYRYSDFPTTLDDQPIYLQTQPYGDTKFKYSPPIFPPARSKSKNKSNTPTPKLPSDKDGHPISPKNSNPTANSNKNEKLGARPQDNPPNAQSSRPILSKTMSSKNNSFSMSSPILPPVPTQSNKQPKTPNDLSDDTNDLPASPPDHYPMNQESKNHPQNNVPVILDNQPIYSETFVSGNEELHHSTLVISPVSTMSSVPSPSLPPESPILIQDNKQSNTPTHDSSGGNGNLPVSPPDLNPIGQGSETHPQDNVPTILEHQSIHSETVVSGNEGLEPKQPNSPQLPLPVPPVNPRLDSPPEQTSNVQVFTVPLSSRNVGPFLLVIF